MIYIVVLISSILNLLFQKKKYYILLTMGLSTYIFEALIFEFSSIDINVYFIKLRYLFYILFLLLYALERKKYE